MAPRETEKKKMLVKTFGVTNKEHYGIFCSGQFNHVKNLNLASGHRMQRLKQCMLIRMKISFPT